MIENPDEHEVDANIAERALEEQVQLRRPVFTHEELRELWTAITQYVDNWSDEDDDPTLPKAATSAQEKLDAYFASVAEQPLEIDHRSPEFLGVMLQKSGEVK